MFFSALCLVGSSLLLCISPTLPFLFPSNSAIFKYPNCAQISALASLLIHLSFSRLPFFLSLSALQCTRAFIPRPSSQSKIHLHPSDHPGVACLPFSALHTFILSYCSVIQRRTNIICIFDVWSLGAKRAQVLDQQAHILTMGPECFFFLPESPHLSRIVLNLFSKCAISLFPQFDPDLDQGASKPIWVPTISNERLVLSQKKVNSIKKMPNRTLD